MENQQNMDALEEQDLPETEIPEESLPEEEIQDEVVPYKPRPLWQVIGAWIALLLFVALVASHYIGMIWGV